MNCYREQWYNGGVTRKFTRGNPSRRWHQSRNSSLRRVCNGDSPSKSHEGSTLPRKKNSNLRASPLHEEPQSNRMSPRVPV
jgi:hypothetical protein